MVRRGSSSGTVRIAHLLDRLVLHDGDLSDLDSIDAVLCASNPDEVYNLGAVSDVATSIRMPRLCFDVNALGPIHIMASLFNSGRTNVRFCQAGTSELYGDVPDADLQNEHTAFRPGSPYAVAKLTAHQAVKNRRERYGFFACNSILFNHESERRSALFVTRKISLAVAQIVRGKLDQLRLGSLDTRRDWGYAPEYVEAMYLMLQQDQPSDYVVATGEVHTVREFVDHAFGVAGVRLIWDGVGAAERGLDARTGRALVSVDESYVRPNKVRTLRGDASHAAQVLGWRPRTRLPQLVARMVRHDLVTC
jgi:GDPmannose 4,6-dehydratase